MSNPIPSSLALAVIANGQLGDATPVANNYSQIQAAVNALITALSGGTAGQFLRAVDGSDIQWATAGLLASGTKAASVLTTGLTFAAGADILAAPLSFTADGTSSYIVKIAAAAISNNTAGDGAHLRINLDGADAGVMASFNNGGSGTLSVSVVAETAITPAAGAHTVNIRLNAVIGGTATVNGAAGGAGNLTPILVTVEKLG